MKVSGLPGCHPVSLADTFPKFRRNASLTFQGLKLKYVHTAGFISYKYILRIM
jgi:hypothetical protein